MKIIKSMKAVFSAVMLVAAASFGANNIVDTNIHPAASQSVNATLRAIDNGDGTYTPVVNVSSVTVSGTSVTISGTSIAISNVVSVLVTGTTPISGSVSITGTIPVSGSIAITGTAIAAVGSGAGVTGVHSIALESSRVLKNAAGTLLYLSGYNSGPAQYIQVYDSATVPVDTTAPALLLSVSGSSNFSVQLPPVGIPFANGISVSNSTTAATKTSGTTNAYFTAVVK